MSGGSYNYVEWKFREFAEQLEANHPTRPHVLALARHIRALADVAHDIEWADSGDTSWNDALDERIRAVLHEGAELQEATRLAETAFVQLGAAISNARPYLPKEDT